MMSEIDEKIQSWKCWLFIDILDKSYNYGSKGPFVVILTVTGNLGPS